MNGWLWAGLGFGAGMLFTVAWSVWVVSPAYRKERDALANQVRFLTAARDLEAAGTRAAATATRATVADAVSLLPSLRCGGGHADHVRRSDVLRIVTPEGTP